MARTRRTYTPEFKAEAVKLVTAQGYSVAQAARSLGLSENLSEGGLFIATHLVRPLGARIEVSFSLPNVAEPIRAVGLVRWVRVYSETSDTSPGIGLRFEEIHPQQAVQIRDFLAKRAPLFYDED